jgi:hypothetical protein
MKKRDLGKQERNNKIQGNMEILTTNIIFAVLAFKCFWFATDLKPLAFAIAIGYLHQQVSIESTRCSRLMG